MNTKPKYKTFVMAEKTPRLAVLIIVIILLTGAFWGTDYYTYTMAIHDLSLTPDVTNSDGVIMQTTDYACAPASLAMLMNDKGFHVTTLDMAKAAHTGIFGTWARGIPAVGRKYGFKVTEKMMNFEEIIDTNLPMIIWERDKGSVHAVYAVPNLSTRVLYVKDPSVGYSILDQSAFYNYFNRDEKKRCFIFEKKELI
jgi:hypothetical protein